VKWKWNSICIPNPALVSCFHRFISGERILILCLSILCLFHNVEDVETEHKIFECKVFLKPNFVLSHCHIMQGRNLRHLENKVTNWELYISIWQKGKRRKKLHSKLITMYYLYLISLEQLNDHLCGLVVRVPGYRSRGPRFDSRRYQIFWEVLGLERGPLSLVRITENLFEWKYSGSCPGKSRLTAAGIRWTDHSTLSTRKRWH
jgi:hypothetical protein